MADTAAEHEANDSVEDKQASDTQATNQENVQDKESKPESSKEESEQKSEKKISPNKIFMANIPVGTTEADIKIFFGIHSPMIAHVDLVPDKGISFVHMKTPESSAAALRELNGTKFNGSFVRLSPANISPKDVVCYNCQTPGHRSNVCPLKMVAGTEHRRRHDDDVEHQHRRRPDRYGRDRSRERSRSPQHRDSRTAARSRIEAYLERDNALTTSDLQPLPPVGIDQRDPMYRPPPEYYERRRMLQPNRHDPYWRPPPGMPIF